MNSISSRHNQKMLRIIWYASIRRIKRNLRIYIKLRSRGLSMKFSRRNMRSKKEIIDSKELEKREREKSQD